MTTRTASPAPSATPPAPASVSGSESPPPPPPPLTGACFCGAVSYELAGAPALSAYCHCTICQRLTGCPFVHTLHFPAAAFRWTHPRATAPPDAAQGEGAGAPGPALARFTLPQKPWKTRWRCARCGACVASANARTARWSVWGAQLRDRARVPPATAHIFYGTRMLDVPDALGKWAGYEGGSERIR